MFAKMYMDTMHLLKSGGFKYFVQGRCSLAHFPKYCSLCTETTKTIGDWIFKDILCRWGTLCEIITDNRPAFVKALAYLEKRYHVRWDSARPVGSIVEMSPDAELYMNAD